MSSQPQSAKHPMAPRDPEALNGECRAGLDAEALRKGILEHLYYTIGRNEHLATVSDWYAALAYTVRDRMLHRWIDSYEAHVERKQKVVCYLSAEFLTGCHLKNNLVNLGILDAARAAVGRLGLELDDLIDAECEPGLGNGGLGRLAACYLDSLATLDIASVGYGIRYEFGIFEQRIENGWQAEYPDRWLRMGNPWEIARPSQAVKVGFGGSTNSWVDHEGRYRVNWTPDWSVLGVPFDTAIPGYLNDTVCSLRLWSARAGHEFDFRAFDQGDYMTAVAEKTSAENLSKVLYPNDDPPQGRQLRLEQQFFLVSCSLQDAIRIFLRSHDDLRDLPDKTAMQINDTHPSLAVAELMRLLIDEHLLGWDDAWTITTRVISYTNHTLLPEALERWPMGLFGKLLPRHLEIIREINRRFLVEVAHRWPDDAGRLERMSIIDDSYNHEVRMAHLAVVGSHHTNGVSKLHTDLLRSHTLRDFSEMWPERFVNVTNGVTPRRWLVCSDSQLAAHISKALGDEWVTRMDRLRSLEQFVDNPEAHRLWGEVQANRKLELVEYVSATLGIAIDPASMFDCQVKRVHEYKRQVLFILFIISQYLRLKRDPGADVAARTFIMAGKAAPGYRMAKLVIKLFNSVAALVNGDRSIAGRLKMVFLPNYSVSLGQTVYPAADLSEQISTAGYEASGTGNMKFALNGALTIGTLDGANIEIREAVGAENFFLFGLTAEEVVARRAAGYDPREIVEADPELREVIEAVAANRFCADQPGLFQPIVDSLLGRDVYMVIADFRAYLDCQEKVSAMWRDPDLWAHTSVLNVARMGHFSSDRAIREYCSKIWGIPAAPGSRLACK